MKKNCSLALVSLLGLVVSSCGVNMEKHYSTMRTSIVKGDWAGAAAIVEKNKDKIYKGDKNRLLYYFDHGYMLKMAGQYESSNVDLQKAAETIDDLWTKSISKEALAAITSDNARPYAGEDHEKVLVHAFAAMNYAALGNYEGARVEARVVGDKLVQYNEKYEEKKNVYKDDGFIRWFSGWLRESEGGDQSINDAKIDYHAAVDTYMNIYQPSFKTPVPTMVVEDLLRSAETAGILDTVEDIKAKYSNITWPKAADIAGKGQLLFLHQNGESPYKRDKVYEINVDLSLIRALGGDELANQVSRLGLTHLKLAFPELVTKPRSIVSSVVTVEGKGLSQTTELLEDITAISMQNLEDRIARIRARTIVRALARRVATAVAKEQAAKKGGALGSLASSAASVTEDLVEESDKRSWITLPAEIRAGRLYLEPGTYNITVDYKNSQGQTMAKKSFNNIEIKAGGRAIINDRTVL